MTEGCGIRPAPAAVVVARLVQDRFPSAGGRPPEVFALAAFQRDALDRAERILERRGGVVIADSVGLGKTYVGLALVERCLRAGRRPVVVVPAALRRVWRGPLKRLDREAGRGGRPTTLVTHTGLARGARVEGPPDLVVVDEAHAFRSGRTRRYRALAGLCLGARVVLITATPINNTVWDLYRLLRLFSASDAFRDVGVPDLDDVFAAAAGSGDVRRLDPVIRAVVVRRTREELRRRYGASAAGGRFPSRSPPHVVRYALDDTVPRLYDALETLLPALTFAPYRHGPSADGSAVGLLRLHLVKRLESGAAAFARSLRRQRAFTEAFRRALLEGRTLSARAHASDRSPDGDLIQLVLSVALDPLPVSADAGALRAALEGDLEVLDRLLIVVRPLVRADPKRAALEGLLRGALRGEKVVVFTEFRDTAEDLWRALLPWLPVGRVDGAGAYLGARRAGRRIVIDRFAPMANGAKPPPDREAVAVLVATDVLAEGLNLQDARHVVCYDLPWNPVRLIQRVGRIDRLGSTHDAVYAHFFLPGARLDRPLGLLGRLERKLRTIEGAVGVDAALPAASAGLTAYTELAARLARGDGQALDSIERAESEPHEPEERLRRLLDALAPSVVQDGDTAGQAPLFGTTCQPGIEGLLLGFRLAGDSVWVMTAPDGTHPRDARWDLDVVRALEATMARDAAARIPAVPPGGAGPEAAAPASPETMARIHRAVRSAAALASRRFSAADGPSRPAAYAGVVASSILDAFAAGSWPGAVARRTDSALAWLAEGHPAGAELALRALTRHTDRGPPDLVTLLERVEELSARCHPDRSPRPIGGDVEPELVAVLRIVDPDSDRESSPSAE